MSKTKKKGGSVFAVLFVIVLLLIVILTCSVNVIFSGDRVPMVAGYYLYLHESADMEPDIPQNSLVFAKDAQNDTIAPGAKVLCYLNDGNMALCAIYNTTENEDGSVSYFPGTAVEQGNELAIQRGNIFAVCLWASKELYTVVQFATSVMGLMVLLVVPCVILIIMLLVKIAKSSSNAEEDEEEDFLFDEQEAEIITKKRRKPSDEPPLFTPEQAGMQDESLEKKKASIQEHFSEKPVNEDSPYQKAVQERTMKFKKIGQEDIERAKQEEAAKAASETAKTAADVSKETETAYAGTGEAPQPPAQQDHAPYVPTHSSDVPIVRSEYDDLDLPHSPAPNIDDVLDPGELRAAKAGQRYNRDISSTGSIDDLIAALEKEKDKL